MAKSRKRGGAKAHRKRVNKRNQAIHDNKRRSDKFQEEQFNEFIKQYEKQVAKNKEVEDESDHISGVDGPEI